MTSGEQGGGDRVRPGGSRRWRVALMLGVVALLIGLGVLLGVGVLGRDFEAARLMAWIRALGPWGEVAVVGLMVVHSFVPFPAEILALAAGALYGTVRGTALIWAGAMLGAALSFGLARWLGQPFVEAMLSAPNRARLERWSTAERGAVTLLVVRFIPVIAFNLINYAAGLTRVSWTTFLWTTGVGILPLTAVMVWMGAAMVELSWPWLIGVSAGGIAVVVAGHWWARRRGWLGD